MALYSATANVTNGIDTVTVVGLVLTPSIAQPGAQVVLNGVMYFLDEIVNTTTLKITRNYAGATASGVSLEINTISEAETEIVTLNQRTADLLEELLDFDPLDNLSSISLLEGNGVIMQDATGQHSLVPKADLTNGVDVGARVETLAERDAYDLRPKGFSVLINDIGDGRAAIYFKMSNANADWSTPAYLSGPVGPTPEVEATVSQLPPGSTATVTEVPITGGVRLDFALPDASGFNNEGVYNAAVAYVRDDVVRHNGSSFIALQTVPAGTSPSNTFPPVDTAFWQVLVAKGADGTGTGDVVGPSGAVADRIAVFDGTTGKLIKDGGKLVTSIVSGPVTATDERIAIFDGITGRVIKDGGTTISELEPARAKATQAEAEAGTGTDVLGWAPEQVAQAIAALATEVPADVYRRSNILGTVSQTGGVPTGAVFERETNVNGEYVRFADGTQICRVQQFSIGATGSTWTFPAAFDNTDTVVVGTANATGSTRVVSRSSGTVPVASVTLHCRDHTNVAVSSGADAIAIGRWF
jgi:hypothetical protein